MVVWAHLGDNLEQVSQRYGREQKLGQRRWQGHEVARARFYNAPYLIEVTLWDGSCRMMSYEAEAGAVLAGGEAVALAEGASGNRHWKMVSAGREGDWEQGSLDGSVAAFYNSLQNRLLIADVEFLEWLDKQVTDSQQEELSRY